MFIIFAFFGLFIILHVSFIEINRKMKKEFDRRLESKYMYNIYVVIGLICWVVSAFLAATPFAEFVQNIFPWTGLNILLTFGFSISLILLGLSLTKNINEYSDKVNDNLDELHQENEYLKKQIDELRKEINNKER